MTAGIDSGPVTVGLTGGSDLVYDAWGATVQQAADLGRTEGADTIYATPRVEAQLSSAFATEPADPSNTSGVAIVAGRARDGEPAR